MISDDFKQTQNASLASNGYNILKTLDSASPAMLRSHLLAAPSWTCIVRGLKFSKLDFADTCKGHATSSERPAQVLLHS